MNWKSHLFYGVLVGVLLVVLGQRIGWYHVNGVKSAITLFLVLGVSPLIPDLDHPMGKLHHVFLQVGGVILAVGVVDVYVFSLGAVDGMRTLLIGSTLILITLAIGYGAEHRGVWHSIPACLVYAAGVWWGLGSRVDLGVLAGILSYSHLVLDEEAFKLY